MPTSNNHPLPHRFAAATPQRPRPVGQPKPLTRQEVRAIVLEQIG